MAAYEFVTVWRVDAPIEKVWDEIYYSEHWPEWWDGVESVEEIVEGDDLGVGSVRRYTWKSVLPYKLIFDVETVRVEPVTYLEGRAAGELEGSGVWTLASKDGGTVLRYDWHVSTTKNWMNILAAMLKPLFKWNHDVVMSRGAHGLSKRLRADVVEE